MIRSPNLALSKVAVLSAQLDFKDVDLSLVVLVKRCGRVAIMPPNFHCEISPIAFVWSRSKHGARKNCRYTVQCLRAIVAKSYAVTEDRLSVNIVRKLCRKVANYHLVYNQNLTGPTAVEKRETFKSHRKPAPSEFLHPTLMCSINVVRYLLHDIPGVFFGAGLPMS